jgi:hypothetical protein
MTDPDWDGALVHDPDSAASGSEFLHRMTRTVWRYTALSGLIRLGVPEQLRDGPLTVTELASWCGAHAATLARVLRAAAQTGLLRTAGPGRYELTAAGTALCGGVEVDRIIWNTDPVIWSALTDVPEILRTGQVPFVQRYGGSYSFLAGRPGLAAVFDKFMTSRSAALAGWVAGLDVFPPAGTVADLGGGRGTFTAAILSANPGLRGILLDLERVAASAREYLSEKGVAGRCEFVTGDFFTAVPAGADVYLLASVIHNWDDEDAARILRTVRAAIPDHGRLLIVETPVPDDDRPHIMKDLDIRILTILRGGLERLLSEYSDLLEDSGFRIEGTVEWAGQFLIVASPVTG